MVITCEKMGLPAGGSQDIKLNVDCADFHEFININSPEVESN